MWLYYWHLLGADRVSRVKKIHYSLATELKALAGLRVASLRPIIRQNGLRYQIESVKFSGRKHIAQCIQRFLAPFELVDCRRDSANATRKNLWNSKQSVTYFQVCFVLNDYGKSIVG